MKKWQLKSCEPSQVEQLSEQLGLSPLVAKLLINRQLDNKEDVQAFLNHSLKNLPDPFLLKDMSKAVERLLQAIAGNEKIMVYGDYDVDGTTSTALLLHFFREIDCPVDFYIPHRLKEGYSLNADAVQKIADQGYRLMITVDNGISAFDEVALANRLGLDVIVTDHHEVPEKIPQALAVINPMQSDCAYPSKEICGAGVVFNLLMAFRQRLRQQGYFESKPEPNLKKYLDILALATVADVVPLIKTNRIFVRYGLAQMQNSAWPGLKALLKVAQVEGEMTSYHLGFRLGPRLNACGRLYDASTGVRLLTCFDEVEANELALELDKANSERRGVEEGIRQQAIARVRSDDKKEKNFGLVLYDPDWHPGVVGIVCSRLVERYHRPVILLGRDGAHLKGSARTFGNLNLIEIIRACEKHLLKCGGHKAACGLSLEEANLEAFRQQFNDEIEKRISSDELSPYLKIDAEVDSNEINFKLHQEIEKLKPFGQGNPEPVFCLKNVTAQNTRIVGEKHLKFKVSSLDAIAFGMGETQQHLTGPIDVAFHCDINEYRGMRSLQLKVRDIHY